MTFWVLRALKGDGIALAYRRPRYVVGFQEDNMSWLKGIVGGVISAEALSLIKRYIDNLQPRRRTTGHPQAQQS